MDSTDHGLTDDNLDIDGYGNYEPDLPPVDTMQEAWTEWKENGTAMHYRTLQHAFVSGYKAGAESRQPEIDELNKDYKILEDLYWNSKCCGNCKNSSGMTRTYCSRFENNKCLDDKCPEWEVRK